jgi:hypothetical protein
MYITKRVFSFGYATETGCQSSGMERFYGQDGISGIALYDEDYDLLRTRQIVRA